MAGLTVRIAGGADREGGGDGPLVVLLHGFGAPGDDLVPLWREIPVPREVRFAFPAAPLDLASTLGPGYGGARAWWLIEPEILAAVQRGERRDRSDTVPDGLAEARARVVDVLGELEARLGAPRERTFLGGFSQGAMLTADVALRDERAFAGLVLMSGCLVARQEWAPLAPRLRGMPVFQSHGRADPILPFEGGVALRDLLSGAGADVKWLEFGGGHTIPAGALDGVASLLARLPERC